MKTEKKNKNNNWFDIFFECILPSEITYAFTKRTSKHKHIAHVLL